MNRVHIALQKNRTAFRPCEQVQGTASWSFEGPAPKTVELRLFWFIYGKGERAAAMAGPISAPSPANGSQSRIVRQAHGAGKAPAGGGRYYSRSVSLIMSARPPGCRCFDAAALRCT